MKGIALYAPGARITTVLGIGVIQSSRRSLFQADTFLYEVQLDHETCIRTFSEHELAAIPNVQPLRRRPHVVHHYVPGEAISTPEGEGIIRNLVRDVAGVQHAIVQLIGTTRDITVPCSDLSPPLEAA
jgi:hypothetical protein